MVMTSALHAEGREFNPRSEHFWFVHKKKMAVPGVEPGSSGSQPLMLTTTPYDPKEGLSCKLILFLTHELGKWISPQCCTKPPEASVAEWLRRQTQVLVNFVGVSSILTGCTFFVCSVPGWRNR